MFFKNKTKNRTSRSDAKTMPKEKNFLYSPKGFIISQRKYQKHDLQKKAVFIAFTALLPHSNILPPQKIDPLFIRILLSHKGKDEKENLLIRYITSLTHTENSAESEKNLGQIYKNIYHIAKDCVDINNDYSKAPIVVDTFTLYCKCSQEKFPDNFSFYLEKAGMFFLAKEEDILQYIQARKLVHPSIIKRSIEYAKVALDIASHYIYQTTNQSLIHSLDEKKKELQFLEKDFRNKQFEE